MTDTVIIELPRSQVELIAENFATQQQADWPESVRTDDRLGEACRKALANPIRSGESELRGSVTIEEKEDGDWLRFSPPEGVSAMVLLDGIGGPIIQRSIWATVAALSKTDEELRSAAEEVVSFAGFMTALTPEKERREIPTTFNTMLGTFGELLDNLTAALTESGDGQGTTGGGA